MKDKISEKKQVLKENPEDHGILDDYVVLLSNSIDTFSENDDIEGIDFVVEEIMELLDSYPDNKNVISTYGQVILNALPVIVIHSPIIKVKETINDFRAKADAYDNINLKEFLSMILVNAIYDFSLSNHISSLTEYTMELIDLARSYPQNDRIQTAGAKGMMNATVYFLQKKDVAAAKRYYDALEKILAANPDKDVVDWETTIATKRIFWGIKKKREKPLI